MESQRGDTNEQSREPGYGRALSLDVTEYT